jgi:hypothetical protein
MTFAKNLVLGRENNISFRRVKCGKTKMLDTPF